MSTNPINVEEAADITRKSKIQEILAKNNGTYKKVKKHNKSNA